MFRQDNRLRPPSAVTLVGSNFERDEHSGRMTRQLKPT